TEEAGGQSDADPDRQTDPGGGQGDDRRSAGAVEETAKDVAPQRVAPKPVARRRSFERASDVLRQEVVRRDEWPEDRRRKKHDHHAQAGRRQAVREQSMGRVTPKAAFLG